PLWEMLFRLAQRLDLQLELTPGPGSLLPGGIPVALDMSSVPSTDHLFDIVHTGSRISLAEVKRHPHGSLFPEPIVLVGPNDPDWKGRLDVGSPTLMGDLLALSERSDDDRAYPFRLISRRVMHVNNTPLFAKAADRAACNPAYMHPRDLA